jgi:hypothetical protein
MSMDRSPLRETIAPVLSGHVAGTIPLPSCIWTSNCAPAPCRTASRSSCCAKSWAGGFEKIAVVAVDKIPEAIADVIAHGGGFSRRGPDHGARLS